MRLLLFVAFFLTAFFQSPATFAQSDSLKTRMWHVKLSPQHLFVDALNLEIERRFTPVSRHSVTFSPRIYNGKTETIDDLCGRAVPETAGEEVVSNVKGYGWEVMHRIYSNNKLKPEHTQYFAYGLNYHSFDLEYSVLGWGEVLASDGLKYYQYQYHPKQEEIQRYGIVAMVGLQQPFLFNRVFTDVFGGLGYHFSYNSNPESERYQTNILDYGHNGLYLTLGFKLGYSF